MSRNDRYRHLRGNLERHRGVMGFREVKAFCEVCETFEPDESGLCPLCQPGSGQRDPAGHLPGLELPAGHGERTGEPLQPPTREEGVA